MDGTHLVYKEYGLSHVLHISHEVVGVLTGSLGVDVAGGLSMACWLGTIVIIATIAGDNLKAGITDLVGM